MSLLLFRSVLRHRTPSTSTWLIRSHTQTQIRSYAVGKKQAAVSTTAAANNRTDVSTDVRPLGERIKENTKTASYMGVIAIGLTVTGIMFYAIFRELMSSKSPNNVYSSALDKCINVRAHTPSSQWISMLIELPNFQDNRVQDSLGAPIKGFGEESRRGRRQHVAHQTFERHGRPHIRMQFYVQGIRNKATVHLEKNLVSIFICNLFPAPNNVEFQLSFSSRIQTNTDTYWCN